MSSSSSPIELTILSVKPQDSHVHHAASHVYAVVNKRSQQRPKRCDKHGDKDEDDSPKNVNNANYTKHYANRLSVIRSSDLSDKIKRNFFSRKRSCPYYYMDAPSEYYTRMLRAVLNKYWKQHPTKQQLYGYLPPILKTFQVILDTAGEVGTKS